MKALLVSLLIAAVTTLSATAEPLTSPRSVDIEADGIILAGRYFPAAGGTAGPGLLLLHGWSQPDINPAVYMHSAAREFQRSGYSVLVPTLRGWPPTGGRDDCADRQVDDALHALEWLAQQPEVDAERRYLSGFSQGGQIALLAAASDAPVRATAAFAPVVDPGSWGRETDVAGIRQYVMEECGGPEGWKRRSVLQVTDAMPHPVLLVHGAADRRVPTRQSVALYEHVRENSDRLELRLLPGLEHELDTVLRPELAIEFFAGIDIKQGNNESRRSVYLRDIRHR